MSFKYDVFVSCCADENLEKVFKLTHALEQKGYKLFISKNEEPSKTSFEFKQSELFICCATSNYCERDSCMVEFNNAVYTGKKRIFIIFENFDDNLLRMRKLHKIMVRFANQKFYRHEDTGGILNAIEVSVKKYLFK